MSLGKLLISPFLIFSLSLIFGEIFGLWHTISFIFDNKKVVAVIIGLLATVFVIKSRLIEKGDESCWGVRLLAITGLICSLWFAFAIISMATYAKQTDLLTTPIRLVLAIGFLLILFSRPSLGRIDNDKSNKFHHFILIMGFAWLLYMLFHYLLFYYLHKFEFMPRKFGGYLFLVLTIVFSYFLLKQHDVFSRLRSGYAIYLLALACLFIYTKGAYSYYLSSNYLQLSVVLNIVTNIVLIFSLLDIFMNLEPKNIIKK